MDRAFLVRDSWWTNNNTNKEDHNGNNSSEHFRICHNLNQSSGYIQFNLDDSTPVSFESILSHNSTAPEQIYTEVAVRSGYLDDFNIAVKINNIQVFQTSVPVNTTYESIDGEYQSKFSGYFTPNNSEYIELTRNRFKDRNYKPSEDVCNLIVSQTSEFAASPQIRNLSVNYIGRKYDNSYSSLTPDIKKFYPVEVYSEYPLTSYDHNYVQGPTNSSGNDSTYISGYSNNYITVSGRQIFSNYVDFIFSTSGLFNHPNNTNKIDKCIFSIRYQNKSGDISNNQNWSSVSLISDSSNKPYSTTYSNFGYGSGFMLNNSDSFKIAETNISFSDNQYPNSILNTTDLLDDFRVRLHGLPKGLAISSAELDLYLSNDDYLLFHTPCNVYHNRNLNNPSSGNFVNSGNNRIRKLDSENDFNVQYFDFYTNDVLNKNFTPLFWKSYYDEMINTYTYHDHQYKNSILLNSGNIIQTYSVNSVVSNYSVYHHFSTSGNYSYLNTFPGSRILSKGSGSETEFEIKSNGSDLIFYAYRNSASPRTVAFSSNYDNRLFIQRENIGGLSNLKLYRRDLVSNTNDLIFDETDDFKSFNNNFIIGDYVGYTHELGISSNLLDIDAFYSSRENLSKSLIQNGLGLKIENISGYVSELFRINYEFESDDHPQLYHYGTPMVYAYNTLITNPSAISLILDYENHTNNPSGINLSGYYYSASQKNSHNDSVRVDFYKNLQSGVGNIEIGPITYSPVYNAFPENSFNYRPFLSLKLTTDNPSYRYDIKFNSIDISFDGWYIPQTGIQTLNFATLGRYFHDSPVDFYLANRIYNSGLDFYTKAHEAQTDYINFNMIGSIYNNSSIDFYSEGKFYEYDSFDMYSQGPLPVPSGDPRLYDLDFYISGKTFPSDSEILEFFIPSSELNECINYSIAYYGIYGYPYYGCDSSGVYKGFYNGFTFVTNSDIDPMGKLDLYTRSTDDELEDSINFIMKSGNDFKNSLNIVIANNHLDKSYQLDFTSPSSYNQSGVLDMSIRS